MFGALTLEVPVSSQELLKAVIGMSLKLKDRLLPMTILFSLVCGSWNKHCYEFSDRRNNKMWIIGVIPIVVFHEFRVARQFSGQVLDGVMVKVFCCCRRFYAEKQIQTLWGRFIFFFLLCCEVRLLHLTLVLNLRKPCLFALLSRLRWKNLSIFSLNVEITVRVGWVKE